MLDGSLTQVATYWGPPTMDGFGHRTFSTPVAIQVRWQDRNDLIIVNESERTPSKAVVYLSQDVALGGYLSLGDYSESSSTPQNLDTAFIIKSFEKDISVSGVEFVRKALL